MTRRSFLLMAALFTATIGAIVALVGGFLSNSFRRKADESLAVLGPVDALTESFTRHVVQRSRRDAWIDRTDHRIVYARRDAAGQPVAFLGTCSHMGCIVNWVAADQLFHCPCHDGVFDEQGQWRSGPPKDPLTRLEVVVESGVAHVRFPTV